METVWVDAGDGMRRIGEVAVWSFSLDHWGECSQASDERGALDAFRRRIGTDRLDVAERVTGNRQVFSVDLAPATDAQIERTLDILTEQREETLAILDRVPVAERDRSDPTVQQPAWMPWRSPAAIGWHIADTESRSYPARLGLSTRERLPDLRRELEESARHVRRLLTSMPRDLVHDDGGELWTSVKLLRRLAWHERVENVFLRRRSG